MAHATLRLLQTTDLHMRVSGFNYLTDSPDAGGNLARLAREIARQRQREGTCLLFDCGDTFQGTPLAEELALDTHGTEAHPLTSVMNYLGYDAIAPGNHDFDFGVATYKTMVDGLEAPIVCANLRSAPTVYPFAPWTVIERDLTCDDGMPRSVRIGVIGFLPPQATEWSGHQNPADLVSDDVLAAARTHLPALMRAGVDVVIALCHSGFGPERHDSKMENALLPLAAAGGFDAILAGHTHDVFPGPTIQSHGLINATTGTVAGVPTVMAGAEASHLGVLELTLHHGDTGWSVVDHEAQTMPASAMTDRPDPNVAMPFATAHQRVRQRMAEPVAEIDHTINSFFSCIGHDPGLPLIASAFRSAVAHDLRMTAYEDLPVLASVSSFSSGGLGGADNFLNIPAGPIRQRHLSALLPFNAPICGVLRRGWQLRQWLEHCAAYFTIVEPGEDAEGLVDPRFPPYQFDWIFGLTYQFDLSCDRLFDVSGQRLSPNGGAVRELTYAGKKVADDDLFVVATSIFRARGGGPQQAFNGDDVLTTTKAGATDILRDALESGAALSAGWPPCWSFAPVDGATAEFLTAPTAADGPMPEKVSHLGPGANGFDRFRLHL